jgi:hypothetical protein
MPVSADCKSQHFLAEAGFHVDHYELELKLGVFFAAIIGVLLHGESRSNTPIQMSSCRGTGEDHLQQED